MTVEQPSTAESAPTRRPTMVVLGGNAFVRTGRPLTMEAQFDFAHSLLRQLLPLLSSESPIVVTHGNGPQVGHMLTRVEAAANDAYAIPLEVCVAETEGELGYVLQQSLHNVMVKLGTPRPVVSLVTQSVVDEADAAFANPTKAVGTVLSSTAAEKLRARGIPVRNDGGKGLRRVVPSPRPVAIIETDVIRAMLESGTSVIAAGGGGIPVIQASDGTLRGVEAVVDKDLASAMLGNSLGARQMVTITDVPCAYREFDGPSPLPIGTIEVADAERLIADGHFAEGSMLPKIQAACLFCRRPATRTVICSPQNLPAALRGESGTIVVGPSWPSEGRLPTG